MSKLEEFFSLGEDRTYRKGDVITFANQDPDGILLLVDGVVEQYDVTSEGNKLAINVFKPGSFFPMSWAINKTPNQYFFAALTDVTVKRSDPDKVIDFVQQNPDVMFDLLSRVYRGTDGLMRRMVLAASGAASTRVVFELLVETYRFSDRAASGPVVVKIKQNVIASRSGLARETVSRELHKLEREGLLKLTKKGIEVDVEALEGRLDFSL